MAENNIFVAVIGTGGVGEQFLVQLGSLQKNFPHVHLCLASNSKKTYWSSKSTEPLSIETWKRDLAKGSDVKTPDQVLEILRTFPGPCVLVDNTSSEAIASAYPSFLKNGVSIVTPNKKAFSSSLSLWKDIFSAAYHPQRTPSGGLVFHESSVGAGLPIISTLKDLVETGDKIERIEGVFSGTMSFLFNSFAPVEGSGGKWSAEVKKAKELGYTEPDPRDDLNGMDVARKCVILARLAGLDIESTSAFPVESLIPKALEGVSGGDEFLSRMPDFDADMDKLRDEAQKQGKVVRFVGKVDTTKGEVKVGLSYEGRGGPIAGLKGSDNLICFYTKRYGDRPLIVQGAGAGREVTAMGVTADLIKVIRQYDQPKTSQRA